MLYVCGTPIGNMEDMTYRAVRILSEVDLIAAEDTRNTLKLMNHFNIKTKLTSYHEHNKETKGPQLIELLKKGMDIAIVTDAGMPGISDPGEDIIRLCYENDIDVTIVPGPTAAVTAAVLSGLKCRSYIFEGFLPKSKRQRAEVLERLKNETRTTVFYEAPHHLVSTLEEIYDAVGERNCAVERELTKKHEAVERGKLSSILEYFGKNEPKGEFVIVIEGIASDELRNKELTKYDDISIKEHFEKYISQGLDEKNAMKQVAKDRNIGKRDVYKEVKS